MRSWIPGCMPIRQIVTSFSPDLRRWAIAQVAPADGAFYAYADVSHLTDDSMGFARRLLDQTGVAIVPGLDFDPIVGNQFVRLSYAGKQSEVEEALTLMTDWLAKGNS